MAWLGEISRQFVQKYRHNVIMRFEFKLPEKYKGTFIEKWSKYIKLRNCHFYYCLQWSGMIRL